MLCRSTFIIFYFRVVTVMTSSVVATCILCEQRITISMIEKLILTNSQHVQPQPLPTASLKLNIDFKIFEINLTYNGPIFCCVIMEFSAYRGRSKLRIITVQIR